MEELLELIVIIIIAGVGILSKASKGKKKENKKSASPWDDISGKIAAGIEKVNELIENEGETPVRKPQMPKEIDISTAPVVTVTQSTVVQSVAAPVEVIDVEGFESGEGDCDHPLHEPVEMKKPAPVVRMKSEKPTTDLEIERIETHKSNLVSGKVTAAQLRQAVVMSEVLGKPVALRGAVRR